MTDLIERLNEAWRKLYGDGDEHGVCDTIAEAAAALEAAREEVERLTLEMGRLQQQYDERTACVIVHRGSALSCSDAVRTAYLDERRRADRLAEALKEIRSRSSINLAMRSDPFELTALLGDIHQIAGAALAKENE